MCLIIASPSGRRISDEILSDAAGTNRDGGGIAWYFDGKIHARKGLDLEGVIKVLDEDVNNAPYVVHFRIATVGGVRDELTHPFSIDERACIENSFTADSVLFHNGSFHQWKDELKASAIGSGIPIPKAPWSDTRAMAFVCHVAGKHILSLIDTTSRYLVFDANEPEASRMMCWGEWSKWDGFMFSNKGTRAFYTPPNPITNFRPPALNTASETVATGVARQLTTETGTQGGTPSTERKRKYKPKVGFNAWEGMTPKGTEIRMTQEEPSQSELVSSV